jgi:hypothetical protein
MTATAIWYTKCDLTSELFRNTPNVPRSLLVKFLRIAPPYFGILLSPILFMEATLIVG